MLGSESEFWRTICQPIFYPKYEDDLALRQSGAQSGIMLPNNYGQVDAVDEIYFGKDVDGDENCDLIIPYIPSGCSIIRSGDNHFGYIGYRANETGLTDDEVIDGMVDDLNWNTQYTRMVIHLLLF